MTSPQKGPVRVTGANGYFAGLSLVCSTNDATGWSTALTSTHAFHRRISEKKKQNFRLNFPLQNRYGRSGCEGAAITAGERCGYR